ncbi:MAG: hypothetical protein WA323_22395 [Candidatus Nitrosopolaris sp.]|jgi:hypothetical protein
MPSTNSDPNIYDVECGNGTVFKIKKRAFDAKAAIDGFSAEEDMRKQFFYSNINAGSTFFDIGTWVVDITSSC